MNKKKKKVELTDITLEDLKSALKVLSKRYVLAPILLMILFLMDHPNQNISRFIHELLREYLLP